MATIVGAALSSHAYTFQEPATWDARRARTRQNFQRRFGREAPPSPEAENESLEDDITRYERIKTGLATVRERFDALHPDVLLIIGDDQDENYSEDNLPQLSVFTGPAFTATDPRTKTTGRYENDVELAAHLLAFGVEQRFDLASTARFHDDCLRSHAHYEPLTHLEPAGRYRVLPLFVNGIHIPAPTPRRCYEFGAMLREAIEQFPDDRRIVVYASGGMSHFSAGFPWEHYTGTNTIGSVCADFDRAVMADLRTGNGAKTVYLSSKDLLDHGDVEMRQTIVLAGMLGERKPMFLEYEPFHRGIMGMAVGYWGLAS